MFPAGRDLLAKECLGLLECVLSPGPREPRSSAVSEAISKFLKRYEILLKTFTGSVFFVRRFKNLPALNSSLVTISNYDDRFKKPMGELGQFSKFCSDHVMLFLLNPCYGPSTAVMERRCVACSASFFSCGCDSLLDLECDRATLLRWRVSRHQRPFARRSRSFFEFGSSS